MRLRESTDSFSSILGGSRGALSATSYDASMLERIHAYPDVLDPELEMLAGELQKELHAGKYDRSYYYLSKMTMAQPLPEAAHYLTLNIVHALNTAKTLVEQLFEDVATLLGEDSLWAKSNTLRVFNPLSRNLRDVLHDQACRGVLDKQILAQLRDECPPSKLLSDEEYYERTTRILYNALSDHRQAFAAKLKKRLPGTSGLPLVDAYTDAAKTLLHCWVTAQEAGKAVSEQQLLDIIRLCITEEHRAAERERCLRAERARQQAKAEDMRRTIITRQNR
jgi:hypothetical protein